MSLTRCIACVQRAGRLRICMAPASILDLTRAGMICPSCYEADHRPDDEKAARYILPPTESPRPREDCVRSPEVVTV